ncbi:hypothetical protein D9613_005797 [Agrocybe pediades]|uniref:Uncharacterized protein n=1 Tax=Agrocybe pediades TaxID=84607 RepID=A0A8H4VR70_9AGAR|nr:hypothetical protein D9613_005797 [Agrocybe pediades]
MPVELPGFYFDVEKNRYFPLSSKPQIYEKAARTIASVHQCDDKRTSESNLRDTGRRAWSPWHSRLKMLNNSLSLSQRHSHEILCAHYESSSRKTSDLLPTFGKIQAFRSILAGDNFFRVVGDTQGWLYNDRAPHFGAQIAWSADFNLQHQSPISSISASGTHFVATCLDVAKISVHDLKAPEHVYILNINNLHDIWDSHLDGTELTLGASKRAVYIPDIEVSASLEYLNTSSDTLSIYHRKTLVYAGTRNGSVERFDMRMPKQRKQKLFGDRFHGATPSSVLHLSIPREHELLMSHLNGDLLTYDLRSVSTTSLSSPVTIYRGHVNTHTRNLGIAVDERHDILFAAGQDCRIRAWSMRTGVLLTPPTRRDGIMTDYNPLSAVFSDPVCALQVTEENGEAGTTLWAASGRNLHQFRLGQRAPWTVED